MENVVIRERGVLSACCYNDGPFNGVEDNRREVVAAHAVQENACERTSSQVVKRKSTGKYWVCNSWRCRQIFPIVDIEIGAKKRNTNPVRHCGKSLLFPVESQGSECTFSGRQCDLCVPTRCFINGIILGCFPFSDSGHKYTLIMNG